MHTRPHTIETLGFEWDEACKGGINFRKRGVRMPEAIAVFDDPYAMTSRDDSFMSFSLTSRRSYDRTYPCWESFKISVR
jgi:hypothetical protein